MLQKLVADRRRGGAGELRGAGEGAGPVRRRRCWRSSTGKTGHRSSGPATITSTTPTGRSTIPTRDGCATARTSSSTTAGQGDRRARAADADRPDARGRRSARCCCSARASSRRRRTRRASTASTSGRRPSTSIEKDRRRWLVAYRGVEFYVHLDRLMSPPRDGYFLEVKSRTWSRRDARGQGGGHRRAARALRRAVPTTPSATATSASSPAPIGDDGAIRSAGTGPPQLMTTTTALRRSLVIGASLCIGWAVLLFITGGIDWSTPSFRLTSRDPFRPALIAVLLMLGYWYLAGDVVAAWSNRVQAGARTARIVSAGLALAVVLVGLAWGTSAVSGSDSYGYREPGRPVENRSVDDRPECVCTLAVPRTGRLLRWDIAPDWSRTPSCRPTHRGFRC